MVYTRETVELTHEACLEMLRVAVSEAERIGQPQCIVIVDKSGVELASLRMTGSKFISLKSARAKARTAASIGSASDLIPPLVAPLIAAATEGDVTALGGGIPIFLEIRFTRSDL